MFMLLAVKYWSTTLTKTITLNGFKGGLSVSSQGFEVLEAPIGSKQFLKEFTADKFLKIRLIVEKLIKIAKVFPPNSFANLLKSISSVVNKLGAISPVKCIRFANTVAKSISYAKNRRANSCQQRIQKQLGDDFLHAAYPPVKFQGHHLKR